MKIQFSFQKKILLLILGTCLYFPSVYAQSVPKIDLRQILGTWYVIGYIPGKALPKDCFSAKAEYRQNTQEGKTKQFIASFTCRKWNNTKWSVKIQENAIRLPKAMSSQNWLTGTLIEGKLQMDPGWYVPFWVDHWILDFDHAHSSPYLVIGGPKRTVLVIYSRTPTLPQETYQHIVNNLKNQGYANLEEKLVPTSPWYN